MFLLIDTLTLAQDSVPLVQDTITAVKPVVPATATVDSLVLSRQALQAIIAATNNDEPSWTDKMQAYAAVYGTAAAVIATFLGIVSLCITLRQQRSQIQDQQAQLNSLAAIAQGLTDQATQANERRRRDIKPYFHLEENTHSVQKLLFFTIVNRGKIAYNFKIHCLNRSVTLDERDEVVTLIYDISCKMTAPSSTVIAGDPKEILVSISDKKAVPLGGSLLDTNGISREFDINLSYADSDGNEYIQTIRGREDIEEGIIRLTITQPVLAVMDGEPS